MFEMCSPMETADTTAVAGDIVTLGNDYRSSLSSFSQGSSIQETERDRLIADALDSVPDASSSMMDTGGGKEPSLTLVSDQSVEGGFADVIPGLDPTTITNESLSNVLQLMSSGFSDLSDRFESWAGKATEQDTTSDRLSNQDGEDMGSSEGGFSSAEFDSLQVSFDGITEGIQALLTQLENSFSGGDISDAPTGKEEGVPSLTPQPADSIVVADTEAPASTEIIAKPEDSTINAHPDTISIKGDVGNDIINAGDLTTTVTGGDGSDVITGGDVAASLSGDGGVDLIAGGSADDTIDGGAGNDFLRGSGGNDQVSGGEGSDFFGFGQPTEGVDTFQDFKLNEDLIGISNSGFNLGLDANSLLSQPDGWVIQSEMFGVSNSATTEAQRFVYNPEDGSFSFDTDGSSAAESVKLAQLDKGLALTHESIRVFI